MKLPKQQRDEIINGLLPMLGPAVEPGTELMRMSGSNLINNEVTRDVKGKQIAQGKQYFYPVEKMVPVDHRLKLELIIDNATDLEDMQNQMGEYLSKHAISKAAVIEKSENFKNKP